MRRYVTGRSPHPKRPEYLSTFLITQRGTTVDASTKFSCKAMASDFIPYRKKKPNPFKIIPLQPTRKENNWETKETMERTTVTLETERAKWPNAGCL